MQLTKDIAWHALDTAQILQLLRVDLERGLDSAEISDRQAQYGKNILAGKQPEPLILKFLHQFNLLFI